MDVTMFYSDIAIIIYEILGILILGFFVLKWSKEKKAFLNNEAEMARKNQEDLLNERLENKKRR